jgi:hypothetical protein
MPESVEYAETLAAAAEVLASRDVERAVGLGERALHGARTPEALVQAHLALGAARSAAAGDLEARHHFREAERIAASHRTPWLGELVSRRLAELGTPIAT